MRLTLELFICNHQKLFGPRPIFENIYDEDFEARIFLAGDFLEHVDTFGDFMAGDF